MSDPLVAACLIPSPDSSIHFLSAAAISHEARKYFNTGGDRNGTSIIEHFPALTLQVTAAGPNGVQVFEVRDCIYRR